MDEATPSTGARVFELPGDAVYPEGVAYDPVGNVFYVGSSADGTVFRGDLASGSVEVFSAAGADGRTSAIGMKVDSAGRLIVAGGATGQVWVYNTADGSFVASFSNGLTEGTFLNDVAVAPNGDVYVADSFSPVLSRIPADQAESGGSLESFVDFTGTVFEYGEPGSFNANGLVVTPDGAYILVVQTATGRLFRVATADGAVDEVILSGGDVMAGDGLVLDGQTLYVVRGFAGEVITEVELAADFASGTVGQSFSDPTLALPTTAALVDGQLLVVNSQFDRQQTADPVLPFTVALIEIPTSASATPGTEATPAG
jgi:Cu-Zn family superoxide dismutase